MDKVPRVFARSGVRVWPEAPHRWNPVKERDGGLVGEARRLFKAHGHVYIVDVGGLENGEADWEFIQQLERKQVFPWLESGARRVEDVMDAFFAGAERVTVAMGSLKPEAVKEVTEMAEGEVFLGVGLEPRGLLHGMRPLELAQLASSLGVQGVVLQAREPVEGGAFDRAAFEVRRAGLPVVAAPWPGTKPDLDGERVSTLLVDGVRG
jgi:hypothetical protein